MANAQQFTIACETETAATSDIALRTEDALMKVIGQVSAGEIVLDDGMVIKLTLADKIRLPRIVLVDLDNQLQKITHPDKLNQLRAWKLWYIASILTRRAGLSEVARPLGQVNKIWKMMTISTKAYRRLGLATAGYILPHEPSWKPEDMHQWSIGEYRRLAVLLEDWATMPGYFQAALDNGYLDSDKPVEGNFGAKFAPNLKSKLFMLATRTEAAFMDLVKPLSRISGFQFRDEEIPMYIGDMVRLPRLLQMDLSFMVSGVNDSQKELQVRAWKLFALGSIITRRLGEQVRSTPLRKVDQIWHLAITNCDAYRQLGFLAGGLFIEHNPFMSVGDLRRWTDEEYTRLAKLVEKWANMPGYFDGVVESGLMSNDSVLTEDLGGDFQTGFEGLSGFEVHTCSQFRDAKTFQVA